MAVDPMTVATLIQVGTGVAQKIGGAAQRKQGLNAVADPYSYLLDQNYRDIDKRINAFRTGSAFKTQLDQMSKTAASGVGRSFSSGRGLQSALNYLNRTVAGAATTAQVNSYGMESNLIGQRVGLADKITGRYTDAQNYKALEKLATGAQNSKSGNANLGHAVSLLGGSLGGGKTAMASSGSGINSGDVLKTMRMLGNNAPEDSGDIYNALSTMGDNGSEDSGDIYNALLTMDNNRTREITPIGPKRMGPLASLLGSDEAGMRLAPIR
jgi:hypothetical protein